MKKDFNSIIRQYGHDVLLQRRTQTVDSIPTYSDVLEKHTVRADSPNSRTLIKSQSENMEGLVNTSERIYYFKSEVNPYEGDRIYEVDYRNNKYQSVWVIDQAFPMRGIDGHIVYWAAGATRIKPN